MSENPSNISDGFKCPVCGEEFPENSGLCEHINGKHGGVDASEFPEVESELFI